GGLHVPQAVPDQTPDVEFVVQDSRAAFGIAVNRARTPRHPSGPGDAFGVQLLRDRFRGDSRTVVAKNSEDCARLLRDDLPLTSGESTALQLPRDAIAIADAAAGLPEFDAPAKPAPRLIREILEEDGV